MTYDLHSWLWSWVVYIFHQARGTLVYFVVSLILFTLKYNLRLECDEWPPIKAIHFLPTHVFITDAYIIIRVIWNYKWMEILADLQQHWALYY